LVTGEKIKKLSAKTVSGFRFEVKITVSGSGYTKRGEINQNSWDRWHGNREKGEEKRE
jgi:hypothetical protein